MAKKGLPSPMMPNSTKLEGKGREGDFVHNTQTMGSSEGFRNVSKLWLDKCKTHEQVMQEVEVGKSEIEDFRVSFAAFTPTIDQNGEFLFAHDGRNFRPTRFALGHIAKWAGVSLFDVEMLAGLRPDSNGVTRNRPQDREALVSLLNSGFSLISPGKEFLFRTQKDGTLRAWLSKEYAIMDNRWLLEILHEILPGAVWSHWRSDSDKSTLWGNMLIPDGLRVEQDSDYGGMFSLSNSEIGRRVLGATPSLFRAICMNGCIWDQQKGSTFTKVHRSKKDIDLFALKEELRTHLHDQIPLVTSLIDKMLGTRAIGWDGASVKPLFATLGEKFKLTPLQNSNILESWRVQADVEEIFQDDNMRRSAFGVINAVTRTAENSNDPQDWVKFETVGGRLLSWDADDWRRLTSNAKSAKPKEVADSFAMVD